MTQLTLGAPEDQLRGPFENAMTDVGNIIGSKLVCTGETPLPDKLGRPDFALHLDDLLVGYAELKAPGVGAIGRSFTKDHDKKQFKRFSAIPNILYTDGNEWAVYRDGQLVGNVVRLHGDVAADGEEAVTSQDAEKLERLIREFLSWEPILPTNRTGKIDLKGFSALLAPLCRMLRDDVTDTLKDQSSPLVQLASNWRQLLFPDASDKQFADAYAQTVTFALLLGRSEGADPLTLTNAETSLAAQHSVLSRALEVLTDPNAREEISTSLDLLLRVIAVAPPETLRGPEDPWLYFYEDFLAAYDPKLRKDAGVYYTPVEVVHCQVRLIDNLLAEYLGVPLGFADPTTVTLDPAVGTGTYLLGVIEHVVSRIEKEQGPGAVAGQVSNLANRIYGFELMVGPYAVSELRISRALSDLGAKLPAAGTHVYLTDTLESPDAPVRLPDYYFLKPIAEQRAKALEIKSKVPVIVCIGNPPYDRHEAATTTNKARTGGWVRWGEEGTEEGRIASPILQDFIEPAEAAGHGLDIKNLYNLYVYFWRWALWKVFEHQTAQGPGIVSFISASSYLDGDAYCGMREHMRRLSDEIWIIDLGGEGRGTRKEDNVFAIRTPVAIAITVRSQKADNETPAKVRYSRLKGSRREKLEALDAITDFDHLEWQDCSDEWQAPFRPAGKGDYFAWPLLSDLMPWQHSGSQFKRTWPICSDPEVLDKRWKALITSSDQAEAFKETRDRKIYSKPSPLPDVDVDVKPIDQLPPDAAAPRIERYSFRSFDRQWIFADTRLGDYLRPAIWGVHSDRQIYLTSTFSLPLGAGPALTACSSIPDLHHFSGRGAKDTVPLYRSADDTEPNILLGLLDLLGREYQQAVGPEEFLAYLYGLLAQPAFTARFFSELESREIRVPITRDFALFSKVRQIGARFLWLHTYGQRYVPDGEIEGHIPSGSARCIQAVPNNPSGYPVSYEFNERTKTLLVGDGEFSPVSPEVFHFEVSGLKVVQSWLNYRMLKGAGRKSSPLDEIRPERWSGQSTTELLEMLWVLEATINANSEREELLESVVSGACFEEIELPEVPKSMRKPPKVRPQRQMGLSGPS